MCLLNMEASNTYMCIYMYDVYIYICISTYLFQTSWKNSILFYLKQSIVVIGKELLKMSLSTLQL